MDNCNLINDLLQIIGKLVAQKRAIQTELTKTIKSLTIDNKKLSETKASLEKRVDVLEDYIYQLQDEIEELIDEKFDLEVENNNLEDQLDWAINGGDNPYRTIGISPNEF